ncbi:MAG: hypothetical protein IJW97_02835 [Clostridia bacterium]|nr:hypothetical protein [Clostridia bacterium]
MKKFLMILLALLLCVGMVFTIGCDDEQTPDQPDEPSQGDDQPDDSQPDDGQTGVLPFSLKNDDGSCRYTVMRSDMNLNQDITMAAVAVRKALMTALDVKEVEIATDWEQDPDPEEIASRYEILIGKTNRPESAQVIDTLGEYSYTIRVVGNKIILTGDTDDGTLKAVDEFINTYLSDLNKVTETLNVSFTYTPDPTQIVLKDNSNGKTKPQIVETKYPTEDVVVADIVPTEMGYAVDPTGKADSTKGIQKALDDCSKAGGGTVYLPAGTYVISGRINIPPFVTLRGDWQDPDTGKEYGTIISVWIESDKAYEAGKEVSTGTFMLGGSGGVLGLTVYYPHQSLTDIKPYPFTFYTDGVGNNYMLSTVKNITVINGYRGIGACCTPSGAHEQLTVENFKGTFLYCGTEVYNQADVGTWQDVTISPKYWQDALNSEVISSLKWEAEPPTADAIAKYTKSKAIGLKLGDLEWTEFESLKVDGYSIGIEIVQGKRIQFAGSLYDTSITNCEKGLVVNDLDPRWGMVIARSTIEGGIYNKTAGLVKLCGVNVKGVKNGNVTTDNSDLSKFAVDYKASYKKPVANFVCVDLPENEDVSAALQKALDDMGKQGGGVVYIPAGVYSLDNPIVVPAGVELRGSSSIATREQGWMCAGTLLQCYYGDDSSANAEKDAAFITLNGDYAGVNGIRIIYPENGAYDANLNSTYTIRGNGKGVYVVNSMIAGSAYGVDFRNCDEHFIKKVTTCCYYNTFRLGGKGGILSGCLQNGTVLCRTGAPNLQNWLTEGSVFADLFDPITRKMNLYIWVDGAENQLVYNTFAYGCCDMVKNDNSTNTRLINIGSDNIGGIQVTVNSGSLVQINSMRWNGKSYAHNGGSIEFYNRLTINNKTEETVIR